MSYSWVKLIDIFHLGTLMIIVMSQFKLLQGAKRWFVDVVYKLRKRYSSISQLRWSGDLAISPIAPW